MPKIKIKNYPMINPTSIVLAGAEVNRKPNYTTIGAFGVVCEGPIFYISLKSTHHTTIGVKETGYFSVNIPSIDMIEKTDYCGMVSGKIADKSNLFTSFYDDLGNAPMISEAPMNFQCKVIENFSINGFDVFFGEIVSTFANDQCFTDGKLDPIKVSPTFLMGPNYFSIGQKVGNIFREGNAIKAKIDK